MYRQHEQHTWLHNKTTPLDCTTRDILLSTKTTTTKKGAETNNNERERKTKSKERKNNKKTNKQTKNQLNQSVWVPWVIRNEYSLSSRVVACVSVPICKEEEYQEEVGLTPLGSGLFLRTLTSWLIHLLAVSYRIVHSLRVHHDFWVVHRMIGLCLVGANEITAVSSISSFTYLNLVASWANNSCTGASRPSGLARPSHSDGLSGLNGLERLCMTIVVEQLPLLHVSNCLTIFFSRIAWLKKYSSSRK